MHQIFILEESTRKKYGSDTTMMNSSSHVQMALQNCPRREQTVRSEDFSRELHGEPGESQPTESTENAEARADSWSFQGDFIYRHHCEPRVQLYVPKDETFPIPLKYIDVTRSTHTDLDVSQEKRIDDYWHIDSNKHLSVSWKGFTKIILLKQRPPKRIHVADKDSRDYQTRSCTRPDARPENVCPEVWTKIVKVAQNREKQEWAKRKTKARQCSKTEWDLLDRSR